jgi:hypothetical protein
MGRMRRDVFQASRGKGDLTGKSTGLPSYTIQGKTIKVLLKKKKRKSRVLD